MKTPKQLRRDIQNLSEHLSQVQVGLQNRASIRVASIGKECQRTAQALEQLLKSQQVPSEYKVAVVGRFKAGKSTFVNELLSNRLAGEGTLPETAAVTTFKHGPNVCARIQFVDTAMWQQLKLLHAENPKDINAHRIRSWEGFAIPKKTKDDEPAKVFDLAGLERAHVRDGGHTVTLELSAQATKKATADFRKKLKDYTSSTSPLHCLVDKIDITAPAEILDHGVLLIDTPGLGDTERFRVALTEKVVADVDAVLFLTKSGASYDQSEKDFLLSLLRKGTVKQLIVVVTQIDETYDKVLKAAEDDDEDPEPISACIARERAKISREIADTLKDLHQDDSLHRYQEQLGDVPIVFTSARLHRDWKNGDTLAFEIEKTDPGGVEKLKTRLLHQLSIESRLAQTAENIVRGASNCLLDLQKVLQTKLRALHNTQNKEVAEQKLHTFRNEFGQACEGFAGSVEQQIQLLTERLGEQPHRDETLLQLIAALAEQPLSAFESNDMGRHWKTRRYGGWGYLSGLQTGVAGLVFPKVQQLLNNRTDLFMQYAQRFEEALLRLSRKSDKIAMQMELGTNVPLDVSGKLQTALIRSTQRAQELVAAEEQQVMDLLDNFVSEDIANRISERRRVVADIWDVGTTARQNVQVKDFYREIKSLLKDALLNHLHESSLRFGNFLLAEAKAAPRDALDEVQVLLEQAADNILAAATLHLDGQKEEATALISEVDGELARSMERVRSVMPVSTLEPVAVIPQSTSAPPAALADIDEVNWADKMQCTATVCVKRLQLREGSTGWAYDKLFPPAFLQGALHVSLVDPHLSGAHQLRNLKEFLLHLAKTAKPKTVEIITSCADDEAARHQSRQMDSVATDLFQQFGVALTVKREAGLHDRSLRLDHGVLFKLGRGLDVYKPALGLAAHHPASRRVRAAEIDVFVQPGHALAAAQEATHE
jgi:GTPase Era involved in 16S rRNA processing